MDHRRNLDREILELYLAHLLIAYQRWFFVIGLLLLMYAISLLFIHPLVGFAGLLPAAYLLLLSGSYPVLLYTARLGAWIGTLWRS